MYYLYGKSTPPPDEVPGNTPTEAAGWYLLWQDERKRTLLTRRAAYLSDPEAPWRQFCLYYKRPWRNHRTLVPLSGGTC